MSSAWTPNAVANAILRLAAGLVLLFALAIGVISGGSWLWNHRHARETTGRTFRLDQMTPVKVDRINAVEPAETGTDYSRSAPPGFIPRR